MHDAGCFVGPKGHSAFSERSQRIWKCRHQYCAAWHAEGHPEKVPEACLEPEQAASLRVVWKDLNITRPEQKTECAHSYSNVYATQGGGYELQSDSLIMPSF